MQQYFDFEKRKCARFDVNMNVMFSAERINAKDAVIRDISMDGARVDVNSKLIKGDKFRLTLPIYTGREPIACYCEVMWTMAKSEYFTEAGIKFNDIAFSDAVDWPDYAERPVSV